MPDSPIERELVQWFAEEYEKAKQRKQKGPKVHRKHDIPEELAAKREEIKEKFLSLLEKTKETKPIEEPEKPKENIDRSVEDKDREQISVLKSILKEEYKKVVAEYNDLVRLCGEKKLDFRDNPVNKLFDCKRNIAHIRQGLIEDSLPYKYIADTIEQIRKDINIIRARLQSAGLI